MHLRRYRLLALCLFFTILLHLPATFADPSITYSPQSNSGTRHEICTTLAGTSAESYYSGEYSYDALSALSGDDLYRALASLMTDTHTTLTSYSDCRDYSVRTDCEKKDDRVMLIYTSYSASRGEYINDTPKGWNREHVWPKSLGGFNQDRAGSDLHHIRPSDSSVNGARGNKRFGEASEGKSVTSSMPTVPSMVGGYSLGNYFEPLDNVKGDVARICLYVYVRWAKDFPLCKDITNVFQSVDLLLEWCEEDPVDTWEMGRNEVVQSIQGNRNVFVDYPELAWLIFDREIPTEMTTPSGNAKPCTHENTCRKNQLDATCNAEGYSGDICCTDCGEVLQIGTSLPATDAHTYGDAIAIEDSHLEKRVCKVCGHEIVDLRTAESGSPSLSFAAWIAASAAVLLVVGGIVVIVIIQKRKHI